MKHVWLIGMMGSGKSVVGKILAKTLRSESVDLDREIERLAGTSVAAIFRRNGEPAFRTLESIAVARAASSRKPAVIATGGGAILSDANIERMRECGKIVWLDAPVSTLARRVKGSSRPLAKGGATALARILGERRGRYAAAADVRVDAAIGTPSAVAARVADHLEAPITYRAGASATTIHVANGLLSRAGELVRDAIGGANAIIVTDDRVGPLYARRLQSSLRAAGYSVKIVTIPSGERHKNAATVARLWSALISAGVDRRTPLIALGGGVLGDLAGFAAATVLRGIPVVQVPTTLVAQVDSAIGGKTGFDLPHGKNLVGAFKHPVLVLADPATLATLPKRELRAGMAEVVKYGVILDAPFFSLLERVSGSPSPSMLDRIVRRCAALKAAVVERDPEERGERAKLNFGHTVGHALEAASRYRLRHGEAVAAGMVAESELACEMGLCSASDVERLAGLVDALGLPTSCPTPPAGRFLATDKKRAGRALRMPLLRSIGDVEIREVPLAAVSSFLKPRLARADRRPLIGRKQ